MTLTFIYEASAKITDTDCGGGSLGKVMLCRYGTRVWISRTHVKVRWYSSLPMISDSKGQTRGVSRAS